jgi:thymidylate synthase
MINIILAIDKNNGIGYNNKLPWNIPEELKIFKQKTLNTILIVGRKTLESLPKLKDRTIYCISSNITVKSANEVVHIFQDIKEAVKSAKYLSNISGKNIFVIGGNKIYNYFFENFKDEICLHISFIKNSYHCDTFFNINNLKDFYIVDKLEHDLFTHFTMVYQKYGEYQYLNLVKDLINNGEKRSTRNAETISDFCKHLKFDLRKGFPLLTTKKMFTKGIIEELLFFIRGDTQTKILEDKGVNIWKGNTNREFLDANGFETREEGEMGPMYGSIWRNFNDFSSKKKILKDDITSQTIDQLKFVIQEIKTNPTSRRILMTSFNPGKVKEGVLWPCHSITLQFYVQDDHLDMFCYNRSSDIGLGLPFNIASSSLLLIVIAKLTNLKPRYFNLSLGDSHIYSNHVYSLSVQIERVPYTFPEIVLPEFNTLEEVEKLTYKDFKIINYNSYETVKMDMIA